MSLCIPVRNFSYSTVEDDRKLHYESIKKYFRENSQTENNLQQRKIFGLCMSLLEDIVQKNPEINKVIDVGFGTGDFTLEFAKHFPQFKQVIGIDFLKEIVDIAQEKTENYKQVTFMQGDAMNMPFNDRNFDITICMDVLHHTYSKDFTKAIGELARVTNRYIILEIRNKKNIFHFWYTHILQPIFYNALAIYNTAINEVNNIIKNYDFKLEVARRIASSRWNCRRLVLMYKRINANKHFEEIY